MSKNKSDFPGVHHFYLGMALALLAFFLIWIQTPFACLLFFIGLWLMGDDFYQHVRIRYDPNYRSPLHRWFRFIYRFQWVKNITRFFDHLFGKRHA